MSMELAITMAVRWVHIASATLAIGGPFFVRFALLPTASKELEEGAHQRLRAAVNRRWSKVVYVLITLFILTGLYNFLASVRVNGVLVTGRWRDFSPADQQLYQMIFGIKMMAAFSLFFLASALAGRSKALAVIRQRAGTFLGVLLVLAAVVLGCSTALKFLPREAAVAHGNSAGVMSAGAGGTPAIH